MGRRERSGGGWLIKQTQVLHLLCVSSQLLHGCDHVTDKHASMMAARRLRGSSGQARGKASRERLELRLCLLTCGPERGAGPAHIHVNTGKATSAQGRAQGRWTRLEIIRSSNVERPTQAAPGCHRHSITGLETGHLPHLASTTLLERARVRAMVVVGAFVCGGVCWC